MNPTQIAFPCDHKRRMLLAGMVGALAAASANAHSLAQGAESPGVHAQVGIPILDPVALALLHHSRGAESWSCRRLMRSYMRKAGPMGVGGLGPLIPTSLEPLVSDASAINSAWFDLLTAPDPFRRSAAFDRLCASIDARVSQLSSSERFALPLTGQGLIGFDALESELFFDAGLVEGPGVVAIHRFGTMEHDAAGALALTNLRVGQVTPSIKAPVETFRIPISDPQLAERLMSDRLQNLNLLVLDILPASACRGPVKGVRSPLAGLARAVWIASAQGEVLHLHELPQPLQSRRDKRCPTPSKTT